MLPGAVVPPSEDHSYAQYRYRDEGLSSEQPSPFKKLSNTPRKPSEPSAAEEEEGEEESVVVDGATGDDLRKCLFCQNQGDDNPDVSLFFNPKILLVKCHNDKQIKIFKDNSVFEQELAWPPWWPEICLGNPVLPKTCPTKQSEIPTFYAIPTLEPK